MTAPPPVDRVPGLRRLATAAGGGSPQVVVAVIDGSVDAAHPVFVGADLRAPDGTPLTAAATGPTSDHATFVASIMAGQPGSAVEGIAPRCRYVNVPVYSASNPHPAQLDLARAIEAAVDAGAHVINLSGGQYQDSPQADDLLDRAVRLCAERDVLLVAAAGNDGCDCVHVPAAHPDALAVGSRTSVSASRFSNWSRHYDGHGLTAPGEDVTGAVCGGGTQVQSGTSIAAPVVSAAAALLLSLQAQRGETLSPRRVGRLLLRLAEACRPEDTMHCRRLLGGSLSLEGALDAMNGLMDFTPEGPDGDSLDAVTQSCTCGGTHSRDQQAAAAALPAPPTAVEPTPVPVAAGSVQSLDPVTREGQLVYVLASLGFDFGNEARRDSFKQLMAPAVFNGQPVPPNPYDGRQLLEHLRRYPAESRALIWTANLELSPIYAIEPVGPYAREVYEVLVDLLEGALRPADAVGHVERMSIPGRLTDRSVRLFSGQVVPVVEVDNTRGMYGWDVNSLIGAAVSQLGLDDAGRGQLEGVVRGFLNRMYYDWRNLGRLSRDRALNFAATNALQATYAFAKAVASHMRLDTIEVEESPYARFDADAWDIKLKFFDPENSRRARTVVRFTVDVSEIMPVTLGDLLTWEESS